MGAGSSRLVSALAVLAVWCAAPADADPPPASPLDASSRVEISAESLEYDSVRDLYVAEGDVSVRRGRRQLSADWMAFSSSTRRGVASGDVVFEDGENRLRTSFAEFDVDTLEGILFDAEFEVSEGRMRMRGAEVAKTGPKTYRFRDGRFTTCRCPDPEARKPWEVTAGEAELELEGYGTARNSTIEVLGVPVVWLPWMLYPLKTERQTGLLVPEFRVSGRNGVELGQPIFFAVGDPVNVTLTPRWLQKRGAKGDVLVEYVLGRQSDGELSGSFIHDSRADRERKAPFDEERWATLGKHDLHLPAEWRLQTQYAFASDNDHPNDFDDLASRRSDRFLDAVAFLTRHFGSAGAYGLAPGARYSDDLQNPDDTDRDDFLLQRLPELRARALPAGLPFASWLVPALDVDYAWYQQAEQPQEAYPDALLETGNGRFFDSGIDGLPTSAEQGRNDPPDDPLDPNEDDFDPVLNPGGSEGDGRFQEGELLADGGQRAVFTPRLGAPLRAFDVLEVYPEAGWHETFYGSDAEGFERRGFLTGRVDLRTRLRGVFGELVHLLEPRLGWAYVGDVSQAGNPLYVPRTAVEQQRVRSLDLENLTRDVADRIAAFNGVNFGFGNRILTRPGAPRAGARVVADFAVWGIYDFAAGEVGNLYLDGRAYPIENATLRFDLGFDPEAARIDEGLLGLSWRDERGDIVNFGYRYLRDIPRFFEAFPREGERFHNFRSDFEKVNQINGSVRIALNELWGVSYRGAFSFERSTVLGNEAGVEYISRCRCWAVRVEVAQSRSRGAQVGVRYTLLGLGDDSRTPFDSGGPEQRFALLDAF